MNFRTTLAMAPAAPLSAHPGFQSQIKVMRGNVALSDAEIDALVCP